MLKTGWKRAIERAGRSQRSLAQALSVNQAELSMVAQGRAFLTPDKFSLACDLLDCRPTDLYAADTLAFMYGIGVQPPERKARGAQVRLDADTQELVDFVANDEHLTRAQAANTIIRRAFETRRIESK